jgi:hypothetical protein
MPGALQVDLSFTPAADFGARGPRFELLFGEAQDHGSPLPPPAAHLHGLAAHHVVRARFCVARGRVWQAEHWLSMARDHVLELACLERGLVTAQGRGFDELPADVLESMMSALPASLEPAELLRALRAVVEGLGRAGADPVVLERLRALVA